MNHKIHFEPAGSTFPRHRRVSLGLLSIFVSGLLIWTALVTPSAIADDWSSQAKQGIPALVFTNPFGEVGAGHYGPRVQVVGGTTIENTSFDVKNPDLGTQIKCFGVAVSPKM